ncbi:hypothetical protein Q3G72_028695 [Acer saccharum]|nr:hypothetical protein Q3G72_028695 [Acer saccharum]
MPMGAGFFEKARADSETWDLGLATNEGKLFGLSPPAAYVVSARNASLHLLASFQLRMPNAYYLVLEANRQKLTLRVSLPALEAKHSARRPGLGAPFAFGALCEIRLPTVQSLYSRWEVGRSSMRRLFQDLTFQGFPFCKAYRARFSSSMSKLWWISTRKNSHFKEHSKRPPVLLDPVPAHHCALGKGTPVSEALDREFPSTGV